MQHQLVVESITMSCGLVEWWVSRDKAVAAAAGRPTVVWRRYAQSADANW